MSKATKSSQKLPLTKERRAELQGMLKKMREASNALYIASSGTGCHPFIEFAGFMNEYIQLCERNLADGVDFADSTEHSGGALSILPHEASYIGEKFGCIFGPTLRTNGEACAAFFKRWT